MSSLAPLPDAASPEPTSATSVVLSVASIALLFPALASAFVLLAFAPVFCFIGAVLAVSALVVQHGRRLRLQRLAPAAVMRNEPALWIGYAALGAHLLVMLGLVGAFVVLLWRD